MSKEYWEDKHYSFFSNRECEYFPCHKGADPENFNCLFCYCPLYALGINVEEISAIQKMELRIAPTVSLPINGRIMVM